MSGFSDKLKMGISEFRLCDGWRVVIVQRISKLPATYLGREKRLEVACIVSWIDALLENAMLSQEQPVWVSP